MVIVVVHTKCVAKMHSELQKVHDSEAQGFIFYGFYIYLLGRECAEVPVWRSKDKLPRVFFFHNVDSRD